MSKFFSAKTMMAALAITAAMAAQAEAATGGTLAMRKAGTLTCSVDPGLGLVFGSVRHVECRYDHFTRRGRLVRENLTGTLNRAGFDIGLTSGQTLSWAVWTPGGRSHPAMMSRIFGGSSADLTVFVGAGTNALFAEETQITLSPMPGSGQVGIGLGFGAAGLDLQHVPMAAYTSFAR